MIRLFLAAAIVLVVLGIIAAASSTSQLWSTWWYTWFMASFLAFLVDLWWPVAVGSGGVTYRRERVS